MTKLFSSALLLLNLIAPSIAAVLPAAATAANTYDFIVVGSGPGGGPLAANLANAGASVLLLEAGSDEGADLNEMIAGWSFLAYEDPIMRWDFFVKYHTNDSITLQFEHLTWKTSMGNSMLALTLQLEQQCLEFTTHMQVRSNPPRLFPQMLK